MITDAADAEEMKITRKKSLDCTTKHEIEKENKNMRKKKKKTPGYLLCLHLY